MKFLCVERELVHDGWQERGEVLKYEAREVYRLQQADLLREVYFTENHEAVLVFEAQNREEVNVLLAGLPLVRAGLIEFTVNELRPYTGFERLLDGSGKDQAQQ